MKNILFAAVGIGLLAGCAGLGGSLGFNASNLRTATKDACALNSTTQKQELRLEFDYTGTLSRMNLTFTPNGKQPVSVNIASLSNPPAGFRIDTLTATIARVFVDLSVIEPTATRQAIPEPNPKVLYPMDINVKASDGSSDKSMDLRNVDVAVCYGK